MKEIIINENQIDKRLDSFLKAYFPNASGGFIYKMLRKKNITLNGKKASGEEKLSIGDSIKVFFADETFEKFRGSRNGKNYTLSKEILEEIGSVPVIYEDDNVLFVSKPAGLLSQKAMPEDVSLNDWLIDYLIRKGDIDLESLEVFKPSICNRLDRNTSGLVICSKSLLGARVMNKALKERKLDKYYKALVKGKITEDVSLKGYLYKDESKNKVYIKDTDPGDDRYSFIRTNYHPCNYYPDTDVSMLDVELITGKPHQIRAHLSSIGHPIIGDAKYGGVRVKGYGYQLLHSYRIKFPSDFYPEMNYLSNKEFISPLPEVFKNVIGEL